MSGKVVSLLRRYGEAWQEGADSSALAEVISPDYVGYGLFGEVSKGLEGLRAAMRTFSRAFPDLKGDIEDVFGTTNRGVIRLRVTGTHRGEYLGIPPTGRPVTLDVIEVIRVKGGQIVESWSYGDSLGLMQQVGAVPGKVGCVSAPAQGGRTPPA